MSDVARPLPPKRRAGLAKPVEIERSCDLDRGAMVAALRVALRLPRALLAREGR